LYLGWYRWADWRDGKAGNPDAAEEIIEKLSASRHRICALITHPGDRLSACGRRAGIPLLTLPAALCRPVGIMRRYFATPAWRSNPRLRNWFGALKAAQPDVGFVFCGGWLPPPLFTLPPLGFLNFHPGPLPQLPGFFPEFFLALWGKRRTWGTFHRVSDVFDDGEMLDYAPVAFPPNATPLGIGFRMTAAAAAALPACLDRLAAGRPRQPRSKPEPPFHANLAALNRETEIDWIADSHERINRKRRCFLSTPWEICRPLHAGSPSGPRQVLNLETHAGDFPGSPGELIGVYQGAGDFAGAPVMRTAEGAAVVRFGRPFRPGQRLRIPADRLVLADERKLTTRVERIKWLNFDSGRA
jgi:methionyl-tRNA formyltransferase